MATAPTNPTALTPPRVALIDTRTGAISREWYRFFLSLLTATQSNDQNNNSSPDTNSLMATYEAMLASLAQEVQTTPTDLTSSLEQQIGDVFNLVGVLPPPTGGTVTSVAASGGSTGLTFSGSPITTSGTLTLGGTLAVASGGTGATTAAGARANLEAAKSGANSDITSMSGITGAIGTPTYIQFDSGAGTTLAAGRLWYDQITGSLNMGMGGGNITQQIGEEIFVYGKASAAITEGQVVVKTGAVGASGTITFAPAPLGTTDTQAIIGVATENIPLNGFGRITSFGVVHGINTTGAPYGETWADGDTLYYNPNYVGGLTKVKPSAPNQKTEVGIVINAGSGGSGSIQVEIIHGTVLGGTDSNVQLTSPTNNDLLQYYAAGPYWRNLAPSSITVGTATNLAGGAANRIAYQTGAGATGFIAAPTVANTFLEWSGSVFQWSPNPLGTVTSVAMTVPTGLTVSGSPITTSGTLAVSLQSGYSIPTTASQANWDTAYTDRLKWDGGSSGLVAATGRTSLGATTVGSNFFTLTNPSAITFPRINADNSVSALTASDFRTAIGAGTGNGSVTSVNVSGGTTGLSFSGGPITTSGTITMAGTLGVANGGTGATSLTAGYLVKGNGTSAVTASIVYDTGTFVGVGMSSPGSLLTVGGNPPTAGAIAAVGASGGVSLALSDNVNSSLYVKHPSGAPVIIGTDGGGALSFGSNGFVERFRIGASGQWGIGGANYGSSGQVLSSQGASSPPSWLTLATVATSGSFADLSNKPGIRSNGQNVISGSTTLGSADKGTNILIVTSGITITFPSSGYASGEGVAVSNISGGNVTLSFPGGSDMGGTLPNNGSFFAFCDGGGFWRQYCYSTSRL